MSPPTERPRSARLRGPLQTGLLDDQGQAYPVDALAQRRARREADKLVRLIRQQLDGLESGEIAFGEAACMIDVLGSLLADLALRGEQVA
jgi:hypothetical protein